MGSRAWRWIVVSARSRMPRRMCTVCCRRASSLPSGDGADRSTRTGARAAPGTPAFLVLAGLLAALFAAQDADAQTRRIVATTSDLASLARAVAGELAQVESIIPPQADPEAFEPRPS